MALFQNITLKQIAEKANVSTATVSRAINGSGYVKKETLHKIQQVIEKLNTDSSRHIRTRSRVILASFPELNNPFYSGIVSGISASSARKGYELIVYVNENFNIDTGYTFYKSASFFDGLILVHNIPKKSTILSQLSELYPVVMCSEHVAGGSVPFVAIDDYTASCHAIKFLLSTGHKRIALINASLMNNYAVHREKGYRDTLTQAGLPIDEKLILHIPDINFDSAMEPITALLSDKNPPDACFCVSDVFATVAVRAAQNLNLSVPKDISIVGFDDIPQACMSNPSITTVRQPTFQLGFQACNLLIEQIEGFPSIKNRIILSTDFIVREST